MGWRDLTWTDCDPPVSAMRIQEVEAALAIDFPQDFRECIQQCQGGTPSKRNFLVPATRRAFGSCLAVLLSVAEDNSENMLRTYEMLAEQLPPGFVPFAEDGGGDYICFDYSNRGPTGNPPIVYWHRSGLPGNETIPLAPNFSSFIQMLT
jgi:cell wall assembly regulator SMI1